MKEFTFLVEFYVYFKICKVDISFFWFEFFEVRTENFETYKIFRDGWSSEISEIIYTFYYDTSYKLFVLIFKLCRLEI
jgi:hypothetical protein